MLFSPICRQYFLLFSLVHLACCCRRQGALTNELICLSLAEAPPTLIYLLNVKEDRKSGAAPPGSWFLITLALICMQANILQTLNMFKVWEPLSSHVIAR